MQITQEKMRRSKVFKDWLLYFCIVLLLPIVLAVIVYTQAINIITNENVSIRQAALHQTAIQIDAQLKQLRSIGSNILLNDKVQSLSKIEGKLGAQEYYSMYKAREDINKYLIINNNNLIQEVYIFYNHSGYMLSSSKTIDREDISSVMGGLGLDQATQDMLLNSKQSNNYYILNTPDGQKLMYLQSMSYNNKSRSPTFTILILTNTVQITGLLRDIPIPSDGTVMLVGENNNAININEKLSPALYKDLIQNKSEETRTLDNFVVVGMDSSISKCKYMMALPNSYYLQKVEYIKTIVAIYLAVCLSLGFALAYYFSKRNYVPLMKMKNALETEDVLGNGKEVDEFTLLELKIGNLINKKEQLQKKLQDNMEITRSSVLYGLLKGKQTVVSQKALHLSDYDMSFQSDSFSVVLFEIENGGEKLFTDNDAETVFPIVTILIRDIFQKVKSDKCNAYFVECDAQIAGIVNYCQDVPADALEGAQYEMEQVLGTVIYYIKEHFDISLSVALSKIHIGLQGIREAYRESTDVLEYKQLKNETKPVLRYSEGGLSPFQEMKSSAYLVQERLFYDLLLNGDYKGAHDILKNVIDDSAGINMISLHAIKFRMFGYMNIMLDALGEIKSEGSADFFEKLDPINRLMNASTLAELQRETMRILDVIVQYFERQESNLADKMDSVTKYINRQYYKEDLCVQQLSEKFGMSVSYLSRMYKKATGYGLLDYIHHVRIEKAKVLLAGGMNIKTVAEKVGYTNSQGLIRAFKRMEGITPGQYKIN